MLEDDNTARAGSRARFAGCQVQSADMLNLNDLADQGEVSIASEMASRMVSPWSEKSLKQFDLGTLHLAPLP